ncbi:MAG: methionine--tRNA ligase [Bdellovibrionales bacterium RBG_16_40_8]|nr:MAG: methionine--tRNA ligase [Bdellovibrionales bacterium RBG_16_40_8]
MSKHKFYLTTPLYYVNDKPHLGTAYATINADVLSRYHRLFGHEVKFLTGTDEHGQKVQQTAVKNGREPQAHCDELSLVFKNAWTELEVQFDIFFRTTDSFHKKTVQSVLQELYDKGDIYSDTYEGWYAISEEIFYTEKDLVNGKSPNGNDVVNIKEKNYFFKMSKYQKQLIDHIEKNPNFIQPENRRNETLGFLRQPLGDLCISRPKTRLSWGIEIPFDHDYVTYVWFDALLNYAVAVGLKQQGREEEFKTWWQEAGAYHMIGKDILITHTVYWPTMLMAIGVNLPKMIFATGWLLNKDSEKMSKSRGSVMDPKEMIKLVGIEPLRYFLVREFRLGQDGPASHELIINRVNTDLANNIGNLLSRTTNLIDKFFSGKAPAGPNTKDASITHDTSTAALIELSTHTPQKVYECVQAFSLSEAIEHVMNLLTETNRYLEEKAPWKMAKTNLPEAGSTLYVALEVLRISASLLLPVMPNKMTSLLCTIGVCEFKAAKTANPNWHDIGTWGFIKPGTPIKKAEPLFPRAEGTP